MRSQPICLGIVVGSALSLHKIFRCTLQSRENGPHIGPQRVCQTLQPHQAPNNSCSKIQVYPPVAEKKISSWMIFRFKDPLIVGFPPFQDDVSIIQTSIYSGWSHKSPIKTSISFRGMYPGIPWCLQLVLHHLQLRLAGLQLLHTLTRFTSQKVGGIEGMVMEIS